MKLHRQFSISNSRTTTSGGPAILQATFRAIYPEIGARLQTQTMLIAGSTHIEYLSQEEGNAFSGRSKGGGTNRAWDLWKEELAEGSLRPCIRN